MTTKIYIIDSWQNTGIREADAEIDDQGDAMVQITHSTGTKDQLWFAWKYYKLSLEEAVAEVKRQQAEMSDKLRRKIARLQEQLSDINRIGFEPQPFHRDKQ